MATRFTGRDGVPTVDIVVPEADSIDNWHLYAMGSAVSTHGEVTERAHQYLCGTLY